MEDEIKDWCSRWPDGNYGSCCETHDHDYEKGGGWRERMRADKKLRQCVSKKHSWWMGLIMWTAVRGAGWTPRRWNRISRSWNGGDPGTFNGNEERP